MTLRVYVRYQTEEHFYPEEGEALRQRVPARLNRVIYQNMSPRSEGILEARASRRLFFPMAAKVCGSAVWNIFHVNFPRCTHLWSNRTVTPPPPPALPYWKFCPQKSPWPCVFGKRQFAALRQNYREYKEAGGFATNTDIIRLKHREQNFFYQNENYLKEVTHTHNIVYIYICLFNNS
jgi:hypothetical protein